MFSGENHEHADLLYTPNSKKFDDASTKLEEWEREPRSNETSEAEKPKKNSKCNLRKSLAWDSAFFTSAGIFLCKLDFIYIYIYMVVQCDVHDVSLLLTFVFD